MEAVNDLILSVIQQQARKRMAAAMARASLAIVGTIFLTGDECTTMQMQADKASNPTGSTNAYQLYRCAEFADDALEYFKKSKKTTVEEPKRIIYRSYPGMTVSDAICAVPGFGWVGMTGVNGYSVSYGGMHQGVLYNGQVYDNNVPFGVPRTMWENGYTVLPISTMKEVTLRGAHILGIGIITTDSP
jgi:hypothetical protein